MGREKMMGWSKILSSLVIVILVVSGFIDFTSNSAVGEEGEPVHPVNI